MSRTSMRSITLPLGLWTVCSVVPLLVACAERPASSDEPAAAARVATVADTSGDAAASPPRTRPDLDSVIEASTALEATDPVGAIQHLLDARSGEPAGAAYPPLELAIARATVRAYRRYDYQVARAFPAYFTITDAEGDHILYHVDRLTDLWSRLADTEWADDLALEFLRVGSVWAPPAGAGGTAEFDEVELFLLTFRGSDRALAAWHVPLADADARAGSDITETLLRLERLVQFLPAQSGVAALDTLITRWTTLRRSEHTDRLFVQLEALAPGASAALRERLRDTGRP